MAMLPLSFPGSLWLFGASDIQSIADGNGGGGWVAGELLQQRLVVTVTNLWKIPIKQLGGQRITS